MDRLSLLLFSLSNASLMYILSDDRIDEFDRLSFLFEEDMEVLGIITRIDHLPQILHQGPQESISREFFYERESFRDLEFPKTGRKGQLMRTRKVGSGGGRR